MLCVSELKVDPCFPEVLLRTPASSDPSSFLPSQGARQMFTLHCHLPASARNDVLSERRMCAGPGQSWATIRRNCQCCFAVSGRGQVSFLNNRGLAVGLFAYIQVHLHSVLAVCVFEVTLDPSLAGLLVGTPAASELGFLCI